MDENVLDDGRLAEVVGSGDTVNSILDTSDSADSLESDTDTVSSGDLLSGSVGDDGYLRVIIAGDESEDAALLAADAATMGYQVSDYWLTYFRGVLRKLGDVDYVIYSGREWESGNTYRQHYYLFVDDDMGEDTITPGDYTCYDAYSINSIYYIDISTQYLGDVETGKLMYSNIGPYSDIREGVSHGEVWAVLFFLAFFAVYSVCHDIFDYVMEHVYRR